MNKFINYLYDKANPLIVFLITGGISALMCGVIWYLLKSFSMTREDLNITKYTILMVSSVFGIFGGLLFVVGISLMRKSTKFWEYAEVVEWKIESADSKRALDKIHKWEFESLRELCMGGPQITELNRLYTIMKTKYKYVK